jgi:hypothetical protein
VTALAGCGSSNGTGHTGTSGGAGGGSAASNGEATKSPAQILSDAAAAIRSARGYAIHGEILQNGKAVRLTVLAPGSTSLELAISSGSSGAEMLILPAGSYVRGNSAFWSSQPGAHASLLANHWVQVPAGAVQSFSASLGRFAPSTLARCLVEGHGTLSIAGTTTIAGRPAIVIRDAGGVPGDSPGTLAVATTGPPYPLRVKNTGPKRPGGKVDVCNDQ